MASTDPRGDGSPPDLPALDAWLSGADYVAEAAAVDLGGTLAAVSVPDEAALLRDGIADPWGTAFFTIRRRAAELPPDRRPVHFLVVPGPLPRGADGSPHRDALRDRVLSRRDPWVPGRTTAGLADPDRRGTWSPADPAEAGVAAAVAALTPPGAPEPMPDHHLALDLGLDSLDRLTLIAELETRLGVGLPDGAIPARTVGELVDAVRSASPGPTTPTAERILPAAGGEEAARVDRVSRIARLLRPLRAPGFWIWRRALRRRLDLEVVGQERVPPRGPCILCPNHLSVLDPFFFALLPASQRERLWNFGAMWIFRTKFGIPALYLGRCLPVDNRQGDFLPALRRAGRVLERGERLVIFPEGMRSYDGALGDFRPGAALLARRHRAALVPVALGGIQHVLGMGVEKLTFADAAGRPRRVRIEFGDPVEQEVAANRDDVVAAARRTTAAVRERVREMLVRFPPGLAPERPDDLVDRARRPLPGPDPPL